MLPGAGCPLFLRAGGFSVLGTVARRRGRAWEGTWELKGEKRQSALCTLIPTPLRKGVLPGEDQHLSAKGRGHYRKWNSNRMGEATENRAPGVSRSPSIPPFCPACAHLFPGDLTQAGVCVPSRNSIPSAVRPAIKGARWGSSSSHSPQDWIEEPLPNSVS